MSYAPPGALRIVGLETEYALGFAPRGGVRPSHELLFQALLRALKGRARSCAALYYKGGDFFENGSLVHFEISSLDQPQVGLLEWATPECLGPVQAAVYSQAQDVALREAIPQAEEELKRAGFEGQVFLLKNNADRFGNHYGCHESYDVGERGEGGRLARAAHGLALCGLLVAGLALVLPLLALGLVLGLVTLGVHVVGLLPGLRGASAWGVDRLQGLAEFLLEAGPRRGSGAVAHLLLWSLRGGGVVFAWTARGVLFHGHLPGLLPFLVTRPVIAGSGALAPDGRYWLTSRAWAIQRTLSAFVFGPGRPLVDVKEFFYRRPLAYRAARKRLHLLAGDANRSEYTEVLKLATTHAVLDALEGGALDGLARRLRLVGGPVGALRRVGADPGLEAVVARDVETGEGLTALQVQRRYLEVVWEHFRGQGGAPAEIRAALARWGFVLDALEEAPQTLDGELDWVIKRRLMQEVLREEGGEGGWEELARWGPVQEAFEEWAPECVEGEASELAAALRAGMGRWRWWRLLGVVRRRGLRWEELPRVRRMFVRLKIVDLKYHEVSREGGFYDWLVEAGKVSRVLEREDVARAVTEPPGETRARIRGEFVQRYAHGQVALRVGWDKVVIERRGDEHVIPLDDPYRHRVEGDAASSVQGDSTSSS